MPIRSLRRHVFKATALIWSIAMAGISQEPPISAEKPAEPSQETPSEAPAKKKAAPSPLDLLLEITKETRPLWRQQYRDKIERKLPTRQKSAVALGALGTDLMLSALARDTQQLRNFCRDQEELEKNLGISEKMANHRQRLINCAEEENWESAAKFVLKCHERQDELLTAQGDEGLVPLVRTGLWVRTWQVTCSVFTQRKLQNESLIFGGTQTLMELADIYAKLDESELEERCMKLLARRLAGLARLWKNPVPEKSEERLRQTQMILDELVASLVQNEETAKPAPKAAGKSDAAAATPEKQP